MADVTISGLTQGTPAGNNILPYSTGSDTLGVPVSAIFHNAGNIGIGLNNPNVALTINGSLSATGSMAGNRNITIDNIFHNKASVALVNYLGTQAILATDINNWNNSLRIAGSLDANYPNTVALYSNNDIRMFVAANGNVKIGSDSNPQAKLDVAGDVKATSYKTGSLPMFGANAFVHFNGGQDINGNASTANTARRIYAGGNVSSVVRNASGLYTIYFTTAMTSTEYLAVCSTQHHGGTTWDVHCEVSDRLTTSCVVQVAGNYGGSPGSTAYDPRDVDVMIIC